MALPVALVGLAAATAPEVVSARALAIAAVAATVGGVLGRRTEQGDTRAGSLLLVALLGPAILLARWGQQQPEGAVWLVAATVGASLGLWRRAQRARAVRAPSGRPALPPPPTAAQRQQAGRDLVWMLLFLAGLLVPVLVGLVAASLQVAIPWGVAAVLGALAATDAPLVVAGTSGRGPQGVVQPWWWPAYLGWLAIRLAIVLPIVLLPFDG